MAKTDSQAAPVVFSLKNFKAPRLCNIDIVGADLKSEGGISCWWKFSSEDEMAKLTHMLFLFDEHACRAFICECDSITFPASDDDVIVHIQIKDDSGKTVDGNVNSAIEHYRSIVVNAKTQDELKRYVVEQMYKIEFEDETGQLYSKNVRNDNAEPQKIIVDEVLGLMDYPPLSSAITMGFAKFQRSWSSSKVKNS